MDRTGYVAGAARVAVREPGRAAAAGFPGVDPGKEGVQAINPFALDPDKGIQSRVNLNERSLQRYREMMLAGGEFPPAIVYAVNGDPCLVDGFHRLTAARDTIGKTRRPFKVEVRKGTKRDALLAALMVNSNHGIQLTRADDENRFLMASRDPQLKQLSIRELGRMLSIDRNRIQRLRSRHAWTRPDGKQSKKDEFGEGGPAFPSMNSLGPLSIPYGKPPTPRPLSELAKTILGHLLEASERAKASGMERSGRFIQETLSESVGAVEASGKDLDAAVDELFKLGVFLGRTRREDGLLTRPEVEERERRLLAIKAHADSISTDF